MYTASETDGTRPSPFASRGIPFVIAQEHVAGDLVKFYGVRGAGPNDVNWFQWFYHRDKGMMGHSFDGGAPGKAGFSAAAALGSRSSAATPHQGGRRTHDHRPQRLAELCYISRSGR